MSVDLVNLIYQTNFDNTSVDQKNYFKEYVDKWRFDYDSMPIQEAATLFYSIFQALTSKTSIENFAVQNDLPWDMTRYLLGVIEKYWRDSRLDNYSQPLNELFLKFILETLKVGPRPKHVELWNNLLNTGKIFQSYLETLPADKWRVILKSYEKEFIPLPNEETREFYRKLDSGFRLLIDIKTKPVIYNELKLDYAKLYIYFETRYFAKDDETRKVMHNLAMKIYYKCNRNPFKEVGTAEFFKECLSMFVDVLRDPSFPQDEASIKRLQSIFGELKSGMEACNVLEGICGDTVDFVTAVCNINIKGPHMHDFVEKIGYYWFHVKTDSLKGKTGIFDTMAPKLAVFLETLQDHSYCQLRLIGPAFNDILCKFTNNTKEHQALWVRMFKAAVKIPGCTEAVYYGLRNVEKIIKWKEYNKDAKEILSNVMKIRVYGSANSRELRDKGSRVNDVVEQLIKDFKKAKILSLFMPELTDYALTIIEERAIPLFECVATAGRNTDDLNIKNHRNNIFDAFKRLTAILKIEDYPWTIYYSSRGLGELANHLIKGIGDGRNLTDIEIEILVDFTTADMQGNMIDPNENSPGGLHFDIFGYIGNILKLLSDQGYLTKEKRLLEMLMGFLKHDESDICQKAAYHIHELGAKGAPTLAPYLGNILEAYLETEQHMLLYDLPAIYNENPEPMAEYFQRYVELIDTADTRTVTSIYMLLTAVAKKQPKLYTEDNVELLVDAMYSGDPQYHSYGITTLEPLAARRSAVLVKQLDKFLTNPLNEHYYYFLMKILGYIANKNDKKTAEKIVNFLVEYIKENDDTIKQNYAITEMKGIAFKHRDVVDAHRSFIENVGKNTADGNLKTQAEAVIDVLEGRSLETLAEDLEAQQDELDNLDTRVTTNETNIETVTGEVGRQKEDIKELKTDVNEQGEKLNELGEVVDETVKKVEEIDQKTLSHAPYWSRDVSKLLNPKSEHDWRLVSSRLGYSNDDIRGWAQQSDPCMAMLNEWYATHKTSEASYGVLTALQEMDRMDAAIIVENAMKAADQVIEDEEFEYASPPPIFLSYQWGHQEEVKLLRHHLEMAGYDCWLDIGQMGGGDKLFEKIDQGIRAAKLIICCTTEKYAKSPNCNREVNLSVTLRKPIIPLLLEDCSWPPPGSMGPIFSEYLYIQFYQSSREDETNDNRFWPIPKFQELLVQLTMNGIVPDESKVNKMYKNWWMPLVEEIKIDKSKTNNGGRNRKDVKDTTDSRADEEVSPDVFISYQWGKQKNVMLLYKRLTELGYRCWMDIHQMGGGDSLYDKIDRGIRGCKIVLSCLTEKYTLSANCRREISLCDALKRPIIPLLLENMNWPPRGPMSMAFTELLYIDLHSDDEVQQTWSGPKFDEMREKMREIIPHPFDETESIEKPQNVQDSSSAKEKTNTSRSSFVKSPQYESKPKIPLVKRYTPPNKQNATVIKPETRTNNQEQTSENNPSSPHETSQNNSDLKKPLKAPPPNSVQPSNNNNQLSPKTDKMTPPPEQPAKSKSCSIL